MDTTQQSRVVVIGAGIGGSALTLLLAHAGVPVTLLEKNKYLGGSCAGYEKHGFQIDFGTHMFSRGPQGPLGEVLRRTGNPRAVEFRRTKNIAEFRYPDRSGNGGVCKLPLPNELHRMPALAARMARSMELNPGELLQATRLVTALMTMSDDEVDSWDDRTVDEFVAQYTENPPAKPAPTHPAVPLDALVNPFRPQRPRFDVRGTLSSFDLIGSQSLGLIRSRPTRA